MAMWLWMFVATAGAQEVPEGCVSDPVGVDGVYEAMELAQMSFEAGDDATFLDASQYAQMVLPCLKEPVTRRMAADWHRLMGLVRLVEGQTEEADRAFAAARTIEPYYRFPPSMIRESLQVEAHYEALAVEGTPMAKILSGSLQLDGRPASERPVYLPTIAQTFRDDGSVRQTVWVSPGSDLPDYAIAVATAGAVSVEPADTLPPPALPSERPPRQVSKPLVGASAGALLTSGVLYAAARGSRSQFDDVTTSYADLDRLQTRTNNLSVGSAVLGLAGLGLGVSMVATW